MKNPKKNRKGSKCGNNGESSSSASCDPSVPSKVWQRDVDSIEEGEELQFDPSAYNCLHAFDIGWPCLSFDIVQDSLGLVRTEFPHTLYGVAGTQAEKHTPSYIGIFKLSNITGKKRDLVPQTLNNDNNMDGNSDNSSSDEEEDELADANKTAPKLQMKKVAHLGCINRIRSMNQKPHICATWGGDTGLVQIWDFSTYLKALAESNEPLNKTDIINKQSPIMKFNGHEDEGYAIDWSPVVVGRLISGDCEKYIYLWEPTNDSWNIDLSPFVGHSASVEDLQWSPTEADIFASCSVDGKIAIWDIRDGKKPKFIFKAHDADVNVISWNRLASCMIASGSDDGSFSIRDLRQIKEDSLVAHFKYHKQPITSVEWSPHEASTLAVSSADHQLTIWDLSLERDEEEAAEFKAKVKEQVNSPEDLPPQLLFVHQGQKDLKELHWHSQIAGMIISTAVDGFNVLMPTNIDVTLPSAAS